MKHLVIISGTFKQRRHSKPEPMLAICSDAETPIIFIRTNGKPYLGKTIWSYDLHYHTPWSKIEFLD
jgi:hypothetical protein